ncbi:hypothetical protein E2C01_098181 [Portunus trituberculatus]|uniref:Uncharacterized protein n=1 Tax=Portunus trituberculatus TaxID=210409 RepID=A0A5B7KBG2_PORTR|nr:hypothetical protein [Portunus trituberculatus]
MLPITEKVTSSSSSSSTDRGSHIRAANPVRPPRPPSTPHGLHRGVPRNALMPPIIKPEI